MKRDFNNQRIRRTLSLIVFMFVTWLAALSMSDAESARAEGTIPPWPSLELRSLVDEGVGSAVHITNAHDGSDRLFIATKNGYIRIVKDGAVLETPFLDISGSVASWSECGLLSVAFPDNYADEGYFFVYYNYDVRTHGDLIAPDDDNLPNPDDGCDTVVARFRVSDDPNVADAESEERILIYNQPFGNHNGGQIAFGPDEKLYIGLGDGGAGGDPYNLAQTTDTLLGKLLRVAVSATGPYTIPDDNPFVGQANYRPEIWASGLRNPWRFSFDDALGHLYIGDVGQNTYEEVNYQPATSAGGENYGWKVMEGFHCYPSDNQCDDSGMTLPVVEYDHEDGQSVTGGFVYRGADYPRMNGIYFYADFVNGNIWGLRREGGGWTSNLLLETGLGFSLSSFGEDERQELYIADIHNEIYRIVDTGMSPEPVETIFMPLIQR